MLNEFLSENFITWERIKIFYAVIKSSCRIYWEKFSFYTYTFFFIKFQFEMFFLFLRGLNAYLRRSEQKQKDLFTKVFLNPRFRRHLWKLLSPRSQSRPVGCAGNMAVGTHQNRSSARILPYDVPSALTMEKSYHMLYICRKKSEISYETANVEWFVNRQLLRDLNSRVLFVIIYKHY